MSRKLAAALVAPLLAIVACSDGGGTDVVAADPVAALHAIPDAAAAAGSYRFEMTVSMTSAELPGGLEFASSGAVSDTHMMMEMDLGAALAGLAEQAGEAIPAGLDEPWRMAFDGTNLFVQVPLLQALTGTAGWLSATPDDFGVLDTLGLGAGATNDPTQLMQTLRGVSDDVTEVGNEDVRGVETTHYRATIDMTKALAAIPDEQRAFVETQLAGLGDIGAAPVDVWVDEDGLARRVDMDMGELMSAAMGAGDLTATMSIEMFDFGEDVALDLPTLEEATPLGELLGDLGAPLG